MVGLGLQFGAQRANGVWMVSGSHATVAFTPWLFAPIKTPLMRAVLLVMSFHFMGFGFVLGMVFAISPAACC